MKDLHDGQKWQQFIVNDPIISPGGNMGRNLALGLCADGISPFNRTTYSMWPMAITCSNLPAHMRMTLPALWVPCIVQGYGTREPDDFSPFLEIIAVCYADELNHLYLTGVEVEDASFRWAFIMHTLSFERHLDSISMLDCNHTRHCAARSCVSTC